MFTGIIQEIGTISKIDKLGGGIRFRIDAPKSSGSLHINDSISINGVCHTIVWKVGNSFEVDSVEETLKKTSMGALGEGSKVNLELPVAANGRFDGHIVQGHVDTTGTVNRIEKLETSSLFTIEISQDQMRYVVAVGSIAVDGVSLTVARIEDSSITIAIIPHTMDNTVFKYYKVGSIVNIEFDILGKYVERMIMNRGA
jgi:riboflavin synthase